MKRGRILSVIFGFACLSATFAGAEQVGPWNLDELKSVVPAVTWLRQDQPIHSLTYEGEKVNGAETEVFAFYASPKTLGEAGDKKTFPGIVLIHGGGGTAFSDWVYLWAKRGYAAIAMDLSGSRPIDPSFDESGNLVPGLANTKQRTKLAKGGLDHSHAQKFDSIGGDFSDDWPFHAAASAIRAHSLIRSFPEVDAARTAVTGISWGGYTTCLVASLDDRFQAAVPVYGCGFLHEGESVQKPAIDNLGDRRAEWVKQYDPGSLLHRCQVPILFVNGTNDKHYVLDSYMKSYNKVPGEKQIRIEKKMRHGHQAGWEPKEIGIFVDSKCVEGSIPLPVVAKPVVTADGVEVQVIFQGSEWKSAELLYTTDSGPRSGRNWQTVPAKVARSEKVDGKTKVTVTSPLPPGDANTWLITVTDNRDAMLSTEVQFSE
ncbi:MAG: acetylxylan esterase [Verrucomicrobiales bacterium]|nr:acetylxylan esterase [Verrucomicrobiales bacterium]